MGSAANLEHFDRVSEYRASDKILPSVSRSRLLAPKVMNNTCVRYSTRVVGLKAGSREMLEDEMAKLVLVFGITGPSMIAGLKGGAIQNVYLYCQFSMRVEEEDQVI